MLPYQIILSHLNYIKLHLIKCNHIPWNYMEYQIMHAETNVATIIGFFPLGILFLNKTSEGVIVGFRIFASVPKSQILGFQVTGYGFGGGGGLMNFVETLSGKFHVDGRRSGGSRVSAPENWDPTSAQVEI